MEDKKVEEENKLLAAIRDYPTGSFAVWGAVIGRDKQTVYRICKRLKETRLVAKDRNRHVLTEKGSKVAKEQPRLAEPEAVTEKSMVTAT